MKIPAPALTLQQVADALGCSRQRVEQIEKEALAKVRDALAQRGITTSPLPEDRAATGWLPQD